MDSHRLALQPLAGEVERVNVDRPVLSLHHSRNELVGVQRIVIAGQDVPDRAVVAARKPGHAARMGVEFPDPANARHGASERLVNLIRMVVISRIVRRFMYGPFPRSCDRKNNIAVAWPYRITIGLAIPFETRAEERHASLKVVPGFKNRGDDFRKHRFWNHKGFH